MIKYRGAFVILFISLVQLKSIFCAHIENAPVDGGDALTVPNQVESEAGIEPKTRLHSVYFDYDYQGFIEWTTFLKHGQCGQVAIPIEKDDLNRIPGGHLRLQPFDLITPSDNGELFLEKTNMNQLLKNGDTQEMFQYFLASLLSWVRAPLEYDQDGNLSKYNQKVFEVMPFPSQWFNSKMYLNVNESKIQNLFYDQSQMFLLIEGANVSVRMALYAMKFEKGEEELEMSQLLFNIVSQRKHNPDRLGRLINVLENFFLVPYVQMLVQLFRYMDPKVTLKHILSDLGWAKLRDEQFYNLTWANANWPRNALQMIRFRFDIFAGDRQYQEMNQFELYPLKDVDQEQIAIFSFEEYQKVQEQIKDKLEKCASPQQPTQTLYKLNVLDTALVTLSVYANYFERTIPTFGQVWKRTQAKLRFTESQAMELLTKTARTPEEADIVCGIFIQMLPEFRHDLTFIRDYMLKGYTLIFRLKTMGIPLYSVESSCRLAYSDSKQMDTLYDTKDLNTVRKWMSFEKQDYDQLDKEYGKHEFGYIGHISALELRQWLLYITARGLLNVFTSFGINSNQTWPFRKEIAFDLAKIEKGELIQDIPHLMQTMLEPSFMNRLNENIIPYTTWTYERQEEPVSPLALKSETKKPVIMAFVNCRLEQSPVKLDDPAYKLTIHLQLDDYKKFKQDCQEMIQKHNLPTKSPLSLVELASVITFEVLVTIESRLGPVLTQEMIESTTVKGGIQFDPLKVFTTAMLGKLPQKLANDINNLETMMQSLGPNTCMRRDVELLEDKQVADQEMKKARTMFQQLLDMWQTKN